MIKPGDVVRYAHANPKTALRYVVRHVDNGQAWVTYTGQKAVVKDRVLWTNHLTIIEGDE